MVNFETYEDFKKSAINSVEKLSETVFQKPEGAVVYMVYNLGYRSFIRNLLIEQDYLTLHNDHIPDEIRNKVNEKYNSFTFKVKNLDNNFNVITFSNNQEYIENMNSASCGVHGKICNQHLLFTDADLAQQYLGWSLIDKKSNALAMWLDVLLD